MFTHYTHMDGEKVAGDKTQLRRCNKWPLSLVGGGELRELRKINFDFFIAAVGKFTTQTDMDPLDSAFRLSKFKYDPEAAPSGLLSLLPI